MARARLGLANAVRELLEQRGGDGRRLSYRQAERLTGLSPATIGELAKGNARTSETVRRFASGMGVDAEPLLLLAGFVPGEAPGAGMPVGPVPTGSRADAHGVEEASLGVQTLVSRWLNALVQLPVGPERTLFVNRFLCDVELLEHFVERCAADPARERDVLPKRQKNEEELC